MVSFPSSILSCFFRVFLNFNFKGDSVRLTRAGFKWDPSQYLGHDLSQDPSWDLIHSKYLQATALINKIIASCKQTSLKANHKQTRVKVNKTVI